MKSIATLFILMFATASIKAAILPTPHHLDYRMTEVMYNPMQVTNIRAAIGITTVIQLEKGERVWNDTNGVKLGDAAAWELKVIENKIFFKPKVINPDTNIVITSTKGRLYTFDIKLDDYPHFLVRFKYPEPIKEKDKITKNTVPCFDGEVNYQYVKWGDMDLSPSYVWDDGRFTCLKFNDVVELPLLYQVLSDGSEALIQYRMEKNVMVVHGISKEFRLRLGDLVLGLQTKRNQAIQHNHKKSSVDGKRVIKHE